MLLPLLIAPVQLDHRVASWGTVVAELARKSGKALRVKRGLADEAAYVALGPHEPAELMGLVAEAASAQWIDEAGTLYLGRPPSLVRKQEREERAADAAGIAASLKPLLEGAEATWEARRGAARMEAAERTRTPTFEPGAFRLRQARLAGMTPIGRLMFRCLRALPAEDLATVPRGTVARFALRPNRRQRPFRGDVGAAQYARERMDFATELSGFDEGRRQKLWEWFGGYGRGEPTGALTPMLTVARSGDGGLSLAMRAFDARGRGFESASLMAPPEPGASAVSLPGYARWKGQPIMLGTVAAAFAAANRYEPSDPAQGARLRDPVANEPLADLLTEPMDALGKAVGAEEAIVALPDGTARDAGDQLQSNPKLGEFADGLGLDVASEFRGGLWLGRARRPAESSRTATRREPLRAFLRSSADTVPSLDAVAGYALAQNPEAGLTGFELRTFLAAGASVDPDVTGPLFETERGGRDLLRAWGGLSPAQRSALDGGGAVAVGSLSPGARDALDSLVFLRASELTAPQNRGESAGLLAEGLSRDAALRLDEPRTTPMAAYPRGGAVRTMDASGIGYVLENQENENTLNGDRGYPPVAATRFRPGTRREFFLILGVGPGAEYRGHLRDTRLDPSARAVPAGELPGEHGKEFRRVYDYYRRMRGGG